MNKISFFLLSALFFNFTLQAAEAAAPENMVLVIDELVDALRLDPNYSIQKWFNMQLRYPKDQFLLGVSGLKVSCTDQISQVVQWVNENMPGRLIKPQRPHEELLEVFQVQWRANGCVYVGWKKEINKEDLHSFIDKQLSRIIHGWQQEEIDQARAARAKEKQCEQVRQKATATLQALGYRPDIARSMGFSHSSTGPFRPFERHPAIKN